MATTQTSTPTILQSLSQLCYTYSWTGTSPVGTVSVQISNDFAINAVGAVSNTGTWTTLEISVNGTPATSAPVSGNTGNGAIVLSDLAGYAMRTVYTAASGTGNITVVVTGKVS
jgi:hypothetical protein